MTVRRPEAEELRAEASVRALAERMGVAWDRKSNAARGDWWAPCPFHQERTPSFHVVEPLGRGGYFKCFGCGVKGSAVDFVMERDGCDVAGALALLAEDLGLGPGSAEDAAARNARREERAAAEARQRAAADAEAERRLVAARSIWRRAEVGHPLLATYLSARGVDLEAIGGVPPSLRLATRLNCWAEGQDKKAEAPALAGPAMVGAIGRGALAGVHRTWITAEGRALLPGGGKAPKKWLGRTGAMFGLPVALSPAARVMIVGEGIESTLAGWSAACRRFPGRPIGAEAALAREALAGGSWVPPKGCEKVVILAEGSAKDPAAAVARTQAAVDALTARGLEVAVSLPGGRWDAELDAADVARGAA